MTMQRYHRARPAQRYHSFGQFAGHAAISAASGIWERRRPLAPILTAAATAPIAVASYGLGHIDGALPWVLAGDLGAAAIAAGVAYMQPQGLRGVAYSTVGANVIAGTVLGLDPGSPHGWGLLGLGAMACQAAWLVGHAMQATDKSAKATRRGEQLIEQAKWDGRVAAVSVTRSYTEWRIGLGVSTRAGSIRVADVAHILNVAPDRVHIWWGCATPREVTIRLMSKRPSSKPVRHPALVKATADEWAPGARSVVDPIPVGPSPAGLGDPVTMSPRPDGDVAHMLVVGATGSGKSYTLAALLTGLMACGDVILAGADIAKNGQTLNPFKAAFSHIALTMDELIADLTALEKLSKNRIGRMNAIMDDKWDPRIHGPLVIYVLEEWAATLSEAGDRADELAEQVDRLAATIRSAGIPLLICTQRADAESMGSTKIRANVTSAAIHRLNNRRDLMGLLPGEDLDLSVLSRQGDALVACGSGGVVRSRAWAVPPKDRHELAQRYAQRPGVTQAEADILRAAGWRVDVADASGETPAEAMPAWAEGVLGDIEAMDDLSVLQSEDVAAMVGAISQDAPDEVILWGLVEALGDADRISTTEAVEALGWVDADSDAGARQVAKTRLSRAVDAATGGAVKVVQRRVPGGTDRFYLAADLAAALVGGDDTGAPK